MQSLRKKSVLVLNASISQNVYHSQGNSGTTSFYKIFKLNLA